jgi:hypothetical protein
MSILRFRVIFDDYDDIYRDIDLKVDHSFADFFLEILKSIGFDNKHVGEFFLADHNWRRGESVGTLSGEDLGKLKKVELLEHIDDPHQKFIFIYDQTVRWAFNIELIKIMGSPEYKTEYPKVFSSIGIPPVQYKETLIIPTREKPAEDGRGRRSRIKTEEEDDDLLLMALAGADGDEEEDLADTENEEVTLNEEDLETDNEIAKLAEEFNNTTEVDENASEEDAFGGDDDDYDSEGGGDDDEYGGYGNSGGGSDYDE